MENINPVVKRIKTFDDAFSELNRNGCPLCDEYVTVRASGCVTADLLAFLELRIICTALNENWEPFTNRCKDRYVPLFTLADSAEAYTYEQLGKKIFCLKKHKSLHPSLICTSSAHYCNDSWSFATSVGLWLKTEELSNYCGNQFIDVWADYLVYTNIDSYIKLH